MPSNAVTITLPDVHPKGEPRHGRAALPPALVTTRSAGISCLPGVIQQVIGTATGRAWVGFSAPDENRDGGRCGIARTQVAAPDPRAMPEVEPGSAPESVLIGSPVARRLVREVAGAGAEVRRVDIVGPGGYGKTALLDALAAAFDQIGVVVHRELPRADADTAVLAAGTEDTAYTVSAADLLQGFSDVDSATNGQVLSVSSLSASRNLRRFSAARSFSDWASILLSLVTPSTRAASAANRPCGEETAMILPRRTLE